MTEPTRDSGSDQDAWPLELTGSGLRETFSGYKTSYLEVKVEPQTQRVIDGRFRGLAHPVPYKATATAVCARGDHHAAPADDCDCGFYALSDREDIISRRFAGAVLSDNTNLLSVQMYGEIIEGEHGYRASHQQVIGVEVNPRCSRRRCSNPSAGMVASKTVQNYDVDGIWRRLSPRCDEHLADGQALSFSQVAGALGVEVIAGRPEEWRRLAPGPPADQRRFLAASVIAALGLAAAAWWAQTTYEPASLIGEVLTSMTTVGAVGALVVAGLAGLGHVVARRTLSRVLAVAALLSVIGVGAAVTMPSADAGRPLMSSETEAAFEAAQQHLAELTGGDLARVEYDAAAITADLAEAYPDQPAAGERYNSDAAVVEGVRLEVAVIGDRVVYTAEGQASVCHHRGVGADGQIHWEAQSYAGLGPCRFDAGSVTAYTPSNSETAGE